MNSTDWLRVLDIWTQQVVTPCSLPLLLTGFDFAAVSRQSLASINNASASASSQPTKVVIALMYMPLPSKRILHEFHFYIACRYPDTRQQSFGVVDGKMLNFSIYDNSIGDRLAAVKWHVLPLAQQQSSVLHSLHVDVTSTLCNSQQCVQKHRARWMVHVLRRLFLSCCCLMKSCQVLVPRGHSRLRHGADIVRVCKRACCWRSGDLDTFLRWQFRRRCLERRESRSSFSALAFEHVFIAVTLQH